MVLDATTVKREAAQPGGGSSRRVKVLLTTSDLIGRGAEREFSNLLARLSRDRFELHACYWRPRFDYPSPADVPLRILDKTRPWHAPRTIRRLASLIDELQPDVVYSQLHYVSLVTGSALRRARHQPRWLCRLTNNPYREMPALLSAWAKRVLPRATLVLGCCEGVRRSLATFLRLPEERTATAWNVVDVPEIERLAAEPPSFHKKRDTFTVIHAAQFHPQKNQQLLLDAFARFRGQNAELWMLGRGPLGPHLQAHAERLGIADQVRWLGHVANPFALFRQADVCALTSDYEGLPNVLIEAMACGTPVVSTRCDFGPAELLDDGIQGRLVPVGDAGAVADALSELAADTDRRRQMGVAAQGRVRQQFAAARTVRQYEELFERAAQAPIPQTETP